MRILYAFLILLLMSSCETSSRPRLHLFVWSETFSRSAIERFEKEYDCDVIVDTYDTNEAMYAKLRFGSEGYDVIMPSNYIFEVMAPQGMLRQLSTGTIPNVDNLDLDVLKQLEIDDLTYGIPYLFSYTGLGYIPERVKDLDPSWTVFSKTQYRGRMTMLNDIREALGAALVTLGYSINTRNPSELDQAASLLLEWKQNLAKFESEQYKSGLASREFLIVQGYSGDILQVISESDDVAYAWPREGALLSADLLAIPVNASNPELAEKFLNFCLQPDIVIEIIENMFISTAVTIPEEDKPKNPMVRAITFPSREIREQAHLIRDIGDALPLYIETWERVLNGT